MRFVRPIAEMGIAAGIAAWLASPAGASDGAIEISQAKALIGGINGDLVADPPNFPVTITQPGSYRLTGDLNVNQNTTAIVIAANDVSIDLGGFGIHGPNTCSGSPLTCAFNGIGMGINTASVDRVSIRNGSVEGMGGAGIYLFGSETAVEDVVVSHNGSDGVTLLDGVATSVRAFRNGTDGIEARDASECSAFDNGGSGILAESRVSNSRAVSNGSAGIKGGRVIEGNEVQGNNGPGVDTFRANVQNNFSRSNGGTAGIVMTGGGVVTGNTISNSYGHGLEIDASATVSDNHIAQNSGCGVNFTGGVAGRTGTLGGNTLVENNNALSGIVCTGTSQQKEIQGFSMATSCNVITCTTGGLQLGTFCPPNVISCLP